MWLLLGLLIRQRLCGPPLLGCQLPLLWGHGQQALWGHRPVGFQGLLPTRPSPQARPGLDAWAHPSCVTCCVTQDQLPNISEPVSFPLGGLLRPNRLPFPRAPLLRGIFPSLALLAPTSFRPQRKCHSLRGAFLEMVSPQPIICFYNNQASWWQSEHLPSIIIEGREAVMFDPVLQARGTQLALSPCELECLSVLPLCGAGLGG